MHELDFLDEGDDKRLLLDVREKVAGDLQDAYSGGDAVAGEVSFVDAVFRVQLDGEKGFSLFYFLRFYSEQIVVKHLLIFCNKKKTYHDDENANPAADGHAFA